MKPTLSNTNQLLVDPRVTQAHQLLAAALSDHSSKLTAIRPPDPELQADYQALLADFADARAGSLFYPYLGAGLGNGPFVQLADGSVKYDMITGIGVHFFGHSCPALTRLAIDSALTDTLMQGNLQQNVDSAKLAREIINLAQPASNLAHCFLTTSGAMANENALKLIFHKKPGADRLLAFEHTFAGRTMTLSQVTDKAAYRVGLPTTLAVDYIPFFNPAAPEASTQAAVDKLKTHLARHPGKHAGMWMELILGEGGFYPGSHEFFSALMTTLKDAGLAIVADEVQSFGRTTRPFAFQHFGLEKFVDIVTVGKMLQVCGTLFSNEFKPGPGLVSQTFTGSTAAISAARWIIQQMSQPGLDGPGLYGENGKIARVHNRFVANLQSINTRFPGSTQTPVIKPVTGPFGSGGMIAFQAWDGTEKTAKRVLNKLFDSGVIAFYCGASPSRIRFLPPIPVLEIRHIDEVCAIVESTLAAAMRE